jgi:hypothetical protein
LREGEGLAVLQSRALFICRSPSHSSMNVNINVYRIRQ